MTTDRKISADDIIFYMDVARLAANRSKAVRLKVGAVVVSTDRVMAIGYNGTPRGWDNCCEDVTEDGSLVTKRETIHAELNALFKFLNNGVSTKGASIFLTHAPCIECAKALHLSGISNLYYEEAYRDRSGIELLMELGVVVAKFNK